MNSGTVSGIRAVLVIMVMSTNVESKPIKAANAGVAIIGDESACKINPKYKSGKSSCMFVTFKINPVIMGIISAVQIVVSIIIFGFLIFVLNLSMSSLRKDRHKSKKIDSTIKGLKTFPTAGIKIPIRTISVKAWVPLLASEVNNFEHKFFM